MLMLLGLLHGSSQKAEEEEEEDSLYQAMKEHVVALEQLHPRVAKFFTNQCGHHDRQCYIFFTKIIKYERCAYLPHHITTADSEPECNIWYIDKESNRKNAFGSIVSRMR